MAKMSDLLRLAGIAVFGFVLTLLFGKFTLLDVVKRVDEAVFDAVVPWLQSIPRWSSISEVATDLGAIPINFFMLLIIAAAAAVRFRHVVPPVLVLGVGFGAHALQNVTNRIVQGTVPTSDVIGSAGPYFSGGVMRVLLLTGIAMMVAVPSLSKRWIVSGAFALGFLEAITRLTLGRHWPIDVMASFPIGFGLLALFRQSLIAFGFGHTPEPIGRPDTSLLADPTADPNPLADPATTSGR